jgi:hypothetical protein
MTAVWVILAFLLGWKAATATGGNPAAVPGSAKAIVHQAVTQTTSTFMSAAWTVVWHVTLIGAVVLVLLFAGSLLVRRARRNVFGR